MKTYICYYSCPFCKNPCTVPFNPGEEFNEMVDADSKAEARMFFNNAKQCRNMKLTRIVEDKHETGIKFVSATVNGESCNSFEEAIQKICDSYLNSKHSD